MNQIVSTLQLIEAALIPYRSNSIENPTPPALASLLLKETKSPDENHFDFYKLFADILFFTDPDGSDRAGVCHSFVGLEELLVSAIELTNSTLEFKKLLLAALEDFRKTLVIHDTNQFKVDFVRSTPKKLNNIITYYLCDTLGTFFLPDFISDLPEMDNPESKDPFSGITRDKINNFFKNRPELLFSHPYLKGIVEELDGLNSKSENYKELNILLRRELHNLGDIGRKICVAGYRANRTAIETPAPNVSKLGSRSDKSSCAIVAALKYLPAATIKSNDIFTNFSPAILNDIFDLCSDSRHYDAETVTQYRRIAWFVLQARPYPWGTRWTHSSKKKPERNWIKDLLSPKQAIERETSQKDSTAPFDNTQSSGDSLTEEVSEYIRDGAFPNEFDLTDEWQTKEGAPRGSAAEGKHFRVQDEEASWGRSRLTDETLGVLLAWLKTQISRKPNDLSRLAVLTFIELQILFGFHPDLLLSTEISCQNSFESEEQPEQIASESVIDETVINSKTAGSSSSPVFIFDGDSLRISPIQPGGKSPFAKPLNPSESENYLPSSRDFVVPLPPHITTNLHKLIASNKAAPGAGNAKLFSLRDQTSTGKTHKLSKRNLNRILKTPGKLINEKITVEKIAKSVRTLLREEGTLSNLQIALLSGIIPRATLSPMFYTSYLVLEVLSKHREAMSRILANLVSTSREFVGYYDDLKIDPLDESSIEKYLIDLSKIDNEARIGSPFVFRAPKFAGYMRDLRMGIEKTNDFVLRHNRMTVYTALSLMTLTGLRPLELFFITPDSLHLDSKNPTLSVIAKINKKHTEWRVLEISGETVQILRDYQSFSFATRRDSNLQTEFTPSQIEARLGNALFFYLRQSLAPVRLTSSGLYDLLKDSSYMELHEFPWKINSPRHFYRTTATESGIPEHIINSMLGHQTTGSESLGLFSAHDRMDEARFSRSISESIWNTFELKYVK